MTNPTPAPDGSPNGVRPPAPPQKTPRRVKAFIIAAALLVVTFAALHLSGGGMMSHTP
jgi:hypothetical protein